MIQQKPQFLFDRMRQVQLRLSESDVAQSLTHATAYGAVLESLICHARGDFVQPLKPYVRPGGRKDEYRRGRFIAMPAYLGSPFNIAGIKWISGFQANIERGIPRASAILILNSAETGEVIAVMDAATLSAYRTAAIASICFDYLAVDGPKEVALLGAGPILQTSAESLMSEDRDITAFRAYDPRQDRVAALVKALDNGTRPPILAARSPQECVMGANVIIAATTGPKEYLEREWVDDDALIVALSLDDPTAELMLAAKIVVDDLDQCLREEKLIARLVSAGRLTRDDIYAELGEIVTGRKPGRESSSEIILVNPMGMAIEDVAVAKVIHDKAVVRGLGHI